ncbi:hypothetical protein CTheo_3763 [Ceratobasidium theobromae]|uniref:Glycosyltransferase family 49 protein n=1 Tax=Ceratobasidium theobromae TaxID=1582974 RepID=A0A5N5QM83_9AGAM|nr:hypothetical protein CTheo_3763 [Ceratobasidium theobromae]
MRLKQEQASANISLGSYQGSRGMYKGLVKRALTLYVLIAASFTTSELLLAIPRTLRCLVGSCSKPLSSFDWTNRQTVDSTAGLDFSSEIFLSKAFDTALKPTKIIPYYYRALHEHPYDDVTVTTIVTSNRFEVLRRLVEQYEGPISATVHIMSTNTTRRTSLLESLHYIYTSSPLFLRWVDVHLVTDAHDRQFNMWRNVARLYARTGWVMMLDVDFAICTAVRERFRDALAVGSAGETSEVGDLARSGRAAFVIPAFEYVVQDEGKDWKTFPKDKQSLVELVKTGTIAMFHQSWAPGHNSTSYERYYATQPGKVYKVTTYQRSYEPYVIMKRDGPPWCDERFVGYGGNKAACLFSIYLSGIDFYVLPDDFLIHQSHAYAEETRKNERKYNKQVYDNFRKELCLEQITQSINSGTLHTGEKSNLREECVKIPGVPEVVLEHLLKTHPEEGTKMV